MNREEKELREALRLNPDDDDLRLVFADWLESHGDPELARIHRSFTSHVRFKYSSTYAVFPMRSEFMLRYRERYGNQTFPIRARLGATPSELRWEGNWTAAGLWQMIARVQKVEKRGGPYSLRHEADLSMVSSILGFLGIEWV